MPWCVYYLEHTCDALFHSCISWIGQILSRRKHWTKGLNTKTVFFHFLFYSVFPSHTFPHRLFTEFWNTLHFSFAELQRFPLVTVKDFSHSLALPYFDSLSRIFSRVFAVISSYSQVLLFNWITFRWEMAATTYAAMLFDRGHRSIVAWYFIFSICFFNASRSMVARTLGSILPGYRRWAAHRSWVGEQQQQQRQHGEENRNRRTREEKIRMRNDFWIFFNSNFAGVVVVAARLRTRWSSNEELETLLGTLFILCNKLKSVHLNLFEH